MTRFATYRLELEDVQSGDVWETSAQVSVGSSAGDFDLMTRSREAFVNEALSGMWKAGVLTDRPIILRGPVVTVENRQPEIEEMRERSFGRWEWVSGGLKPPPSLSDLTLEPAPEPTPFPGITKEATS